MKIDNAKVVWRDDEVDTAIGIPVEILPNGWIHTPETDCYYPAEEVVEVEEYAADSNSKADGDSR